MDIDVMERFEPPVSIIRLEIEQAVLKIENDTEYDFTSAVFMSNLTKGLRLAKATEAGAVHTNDMTAQGQSTLPYGTRFSASDRNTVGNSDIQYREEI